MYIYIYIDKQYINRHDVKSNIASYKYIYIYIISNCVDINAGLSFGEVDAPKGIFTCFAFALIR